MRKSIYIILASCSLLLGAILLLINFYGLTQSLAPADIRTEHLRFKERDVTMTKSEFFTNLPKQQYESAADYAARLTTAISATLAHIHWLDYHPTQFHQRVPIWENYILYFMGVFSGIPEFERYHFSNPEKSIERGIGICGDASMVLSQLLTRQGIANKIITFPGHVMVEADYGEQKQLLGPDYGVVFEQNANYYQKNPDEFIRMYHQAGYVNDAEVYLSEGIQQSITYWDGVSHFITKKYYFEKLAYWLKWPLPIFMLISGFMLFRKTKVKC